jgi:hypothetical protein
MRGRVRRIRRDAAIDLGGLDTVLSNWRIVKCVDDIVRHAGVVRVREGGLNCMVHAPAWISRIETVPILLLVALTTTFKLGEHAKKGGFLSVWPTY